jgi:hypothetical protein
MFHNVRDVDALRHSGAVVTIHTFTLPGIATVSVFVGGRVSEFVVCLRS